MEQKFQNIPAEVVNSSRPVLVAYGAYYGKQIFMVVPRNIDKDYEKDVTANVNRLLRPVKFFQIVAIDVIDMRLTVDAQNEPVIIFNDRPEFQFPIQEPRFKKPTNDAVREALEAHDRGLTPVFFADRAALEKEVNALNYRGKKFLEDFAEKIFSHAGLFSDMMAAEAARSKEYNEQMNKVKIQLESEAYRDALGENAVQVNINVSE